MSAYLRRHPRFVTQQKVEIELLDRAELREVWTIDISQGGMFLETEEPPPFGTELELHLSTPDGAIKLHGRVVHVVDREAAQAFNQPPGAGVQFVDLTQSMRERIERYVKGLADRLTEDLRSGPEMEPLEILFGQAREITAAIASSDLYGALGISPAASLKDVQQRVDELCRKFAHPPPECSPAKAARLAQVSRQIERVATLFANPLRRLHFDFNHGHTRVEERRAAGEDFAQLRTVWSEAFPERVVKAKEISKQAIRAEESDRFGEAADLAQAALELDPFNEELRAAEATWRGGTGSAPPALPPEALIEESELDPSQAMQELLAINPKLESMSQAQLLGVDNDAQVNAVTGAYLERLHRYDLAALRGRVPPSVLRIAADYQRRLETAYKALTDKALHQEQAAAGASVEDLKHFMDANTKNEMGLVFMRKNDYASAREMFRVARELDPANNEYKANFAWSLIVDANVARAEAMATAKPLLEEVLAATPVKTGHDKKLRARYLFYLGRLLRTEGQAATAKTYFEEAVRLDASLTEAATELRIVETQRQRGDSGKKGFFKK